MVVEAAEGVVSSTSAPTGSAGWPVSPPISPRWLESASSRWPPRTAGARRAAAAVHLGPAPGVVKACRVAGWSRETGEGRARPGGWRGRHLSLAERARGPPCWCCAARPPTPSSRPRGTRGCANVGREWGGMGQVRRGGGGGGRARAVGDLWQHHHHVARQHLERQMAHS